MGDRSRGSSEREQRQFQRGRPPSEAAHQTILDATLTLLVEVGFSALTVEGVAAARCGT